MWFWICLFVFLAGLVIGILVGAALVAGWEVRYQRELEAHVQEQLGRLDDAQ